MISRLRHWAARSQHPVAAAIRRGKRMLEGFTLPAPRIITLPLLYVFVFLRGIIFFLRRHFLAEPLLKAYCTSFGRGVTTGIFVPWVKGSGELILGDGVCFNGKTSIGFAAQFVARPRLTIGSHSNIGHDTSFVVGREIRIGEHVLIASGVSMRDSSGHPSDPHKRRSGAPPDADEVRPIEIGDNVWIGSGAVILPGAQIGEGSIVAALSVVSSAVQAYTVVAGNPARRIGKLTPPDAVDDLPADAPATAGTAAPAAPPADGAADP